MSTTGSDSEPDDGEELSDINSTAIKQ